MYLKSLEIQGFKSFPEKTRLTFDKPITAIVGPNGSGKSNIADALMWVMGEQSSKTLRGGKMEDVIFGGTQRRAQVGFAEVSLVIDNEDRRLALDNSEVMITRRYYRSGDSEYYINRTLVRLRDVNELLMDTGLGREGYSIIGQGKIDEILSVKSRDRREIFEEAAGISRYRHRKEETERKLQQTEENLVRVNDKISELELQVEPLREQAETAKRYLMLRDELRGLEISVWLTELENLQELTRKLAEDQSSARKALEDAGRALEDAYNRGETITERLREGETQAEGLRSMISSLEARASELESEAAVLRSQIEGNISQIDRIGQEIRSGEDRHGGIGAQITERASRLGEIENEKQELEQSAETHIRELSEIAGSAGESAREISGLLSRETGVQSALSDKRAELSALASQAQELYDREAAVIRDLAALSEKREGIAAGQGELKAENDKTLEEAQSIRNMINGFNLRVQNRRKKAEEAEENTSRLTNELQTMRSRIGLLTEMEKEYQGYSKAVRLVMQDAARGTLKNIHGTVASLVKTDDAYTVAIETALGGAMQNIIVGTEEDGKAAINMLKRRDGGRATFLPVSTIKGNTLSERDFGRDEGFEGIALSLVEYDSQYAGIYASILGRVVVARDLNCAIAIARAHGYKFKIVTLDGQVINYGGSMTGGSTVRDAGILSRANELGKLTERIDALGATLAEAERELSERRRELSAAEYELQTASGELRTVEDKLLEHKSGLKHYEQLLEAADESLAAQKSEQDALRARTRVNAEETERTRGEISKLEAELSGLQADIEEASKGQEQLQKARERTDAALSEIRARLASLEAEHGALSKAVTELSALRDEMLSSRQRQLETVEDLKSRNDMIRADITDKERRNAEVSDKLVQYRNSLTDIAAKKLELEGERTRLSRETQDKNKEQLDLERECSRLEQKAIAAQMEEKQIIDRLWDNYELSRTAAMNARQEIQSVASANRRISELRRAIAELGNPNIGAIDEFERVNTRYEYLTSQRDDVEKAKTELAGIVNEITEHMREIFLREFKIIGESFQETFTELFGGGSASLTLNDDGDALNCGIEIHVQPPGKSLRTLTLLSGGEKAFVAIALYFAILKVRPTPFVVMDEIEAALDDANVLRFAERLRLMSSKTQMIVISHRRGTMEEADVLYGVTMQEMGVSRVLMIDLEEAERRLAIEKAV